MFRLIIPSTCQPAVGSDSKNGVRHQRALSPRLSMMMMTCQPLAVAKSNGWVCYTRSTPFLGLWLNRRS